MKELIESLNVKERTLMRALLSAEAEKWCGCPMECDLARVGVAAFDRGVYDHHAIARHLTPEIVAKVLGSKA